MYTRVKNYVRSNKNTFTNVNEVIVLRESVIKATVINAETGEYYSCELINNSVIIVDDRGAKSLGIIGGDYIKN